MSQDDYNSREGLSTAALFEVMDKNLDHVQPCADEFSKALAKDYTDGLDDFMRAFNAVKDAIHVHVKDVIEFLRACMDDALSSDDEAKMLRVQELIQVTHSHIKFQADGLKALEDAAAEKLGAAVADHNISTKDALADLEAKYVAVVEEFCGDLARDAAMMSIIRSVF